MSRRRLRLVVVILTLTGALLWAPVRPADVFGIRVAGQALGERILRFHSDITVQVDGTMEVREAIRVRAEGDQIRRGIYRDFPTRYRDRYGNRVVVTFDVVEVLRDDQAEAWHTEAISNGVRVYFGSEDVFLDSGEYTYTLAYRTTRQLGFFEDHDELYWNVTGNGWDFAIDEASAAITLPPGIEAGTVRTIGFTGPQGSTEEAYESTVDPGPIVRIQATRVLESNEGLTVAVAWPKGFVSEPTREERLAYLVSDNRPAIAALAGLAVVFLYYVVTWVWVGKDPSRGVIAPLYDPPAKMSPAAMRYLMKMGWDDRVLSASLINMAVKRFLSITQENGSFRLKRTGLTTTLSPEEKVVAGKLFSTGNEIDLDQGNRTRVKAALDGLRARLKSHLHTVYFVTNRRYLWPGIGLSFLALAAVALSPVGGQKLAALFICVWLAGWSVGVLTLVVTTWHAWKAALAGGVGPKASAVLLTVFSLPFIGGEIAGIGLLVQTTSVAVVVALAAVVAINVVFFHLLKAPTRAGRDLLDKIEGFKMFLTAVEKDRWNVLNPPDRTVKVFEKYLPYALALDVEQEWSEQFSDVLAAENQDGQPAYSPAWYRGTSWNSTQVATFATSVGTAMSAAVAASAATSSGSSSGFGGGGSSGGGGGGGGGGGW